MTLADFTRWVDDVLERATFLPADPVDARSDAARRRRRRSRRWRARCCGRSPPSSCPAPTTAGSARWPVAIRSCRAAPTQALGAAAIAERQRDAELLAFAQLLRLPRVTLLRRRADGAEPLATARWSSACASRSRERGGRRLARLARPARSNGAVAADADAAAAAPSVRRRAPAAAPLGQRLRGPARLPVSLLRAARAAACAQPTSSTPRSRSATTATGCTRCCTRSIAAREPRRRRRRRPRACTRIGATSLAARRASTRPSSCRSAPRFACFVPRYVAWLHERDAGGARGRAARVELRAAPRALGGRRAARPHRPHRPSSTAAGRRSS